MLFVAYHIVFISFLIYLNSFISTFYYLFLNKKDETDL